MAYHTTVRYYFIITGIIIIISSNMITTISTIITIIIILLLLLLSHRVWAKNGDGGEDGCYQCLVLQLLLWWLWLKGGLKVDTDRWGTPSMLDIKLHV